MREFQIRGGRAQDIEELVALSLLAWEPVYASFRELLGPAIYSIIYPDWQKLQQETVETFCRERENTFLLVAEADGAAVGFVVYELNPANRSAEVQLLAVHPEYQNDGIGTALNDAALIAMKEAGMRLAEVATGGDPSHAPARRAYEKSGYTALPLVRYYKDL